MTKIKFQMRNVAAIAACLAVTMFASCKKDTPDLNGTVTISPTANVFTGTELTAAYSGTEKVTWQWNKNETAINGATAEKYTPTEAGNYTVTANAAGYNSKTSVVVEVLQTFKVSGTLGSGLSDYTKVSIKFWGSDVPDEDQNYVATVPVSSGTFNLTLTATPAAGDWLDVKTFWGWGNTPGVTVSDLNAKLSELSICARKAGGERQWLRLENTSTVSYDLVYYVYADRAVNFVGIVEHSNGKNTYDVKLKKGWNYIVFVDTKGNDGKWTETITANGIIPTNCKWEISE